MSAEPLPARTFSLRRDSRVAHYRIEKKIGAGGMGEVYRAFDVKLERPVALKVLPPHLLSDADRVRRFIHEAKSASALNHPNIVTIYDIGQARIEAETTSMLGPGEEPEQFTVHYLAMEYIQGDTLRERIDGGAEIGELFHIIAAVCDGLAKAHEAGIVHRDLKPDNIMISTDGYAKIVDFGLAKLVEQQANASAERMTQTGMVVGTVGYMSPEQVQGITITAATDVFALGCIIYECATGHRAFESDRAIDTMHKILFTDPLPVSAQKADAPAELQPIIDRCLMKEPAERYGSVRELARSLRAVAARDAEITGAPTSIGQEVSLNAATAVRPPAGPKARAVNSQGIAVSAVAAAAAADPPAAPRRRSGATKWLAETASTIFRFSAIAALIGVVYIWLTIPDADALRVANPDSVHGHKLSSWTQYDDVAPAMRRAVINSTDPLFLERKPLQLEKLVSSVGVLFKPERELYAPSEITKTVVRQLFPPHPFNPFGPTRSWIAAAVLESSLTRRRIMELYLNVATFGSSQGVEEAAKHYYGSSPSGLSKKNAAGLAIASMSQSLDPAEPTDEFTRAQNDLVKTLGTEPVEESAPKKEKSRASKRKGPAE